MRAEEWRKRRVQTVWPHDLLVALDTVMKESRPEREAKRCRLCGRLLTSEERILSPDQDLCHACATRRLFKHEPWW